MLVQGSKEAVAAMLRGRAEEARVCTVSQLEATGLVTCEVKKIKESKKPRTNQDFLHLGAWMNDGGKLRRQSQCIEQDLSTELSLKCL